jgi:hypothetical protein
LAVILAGGGGEALSNIYNPEGDKKKTVKKTVNHIQMGGK